MNIIPSYKVFARTYRPKAFHEILGQEVAVQIFQNALRQNTLSHAILMTGIRGIGKTTSARLLAKTLCCLSPVDHINPCGACDSCLAFEKEQHTDIVEMDAASHTGVDDIREIIEGVSYAPIYGRYRVYIIDEVHMLSKNAFNALLKTLEEPPAHAKFIFATTELEKVPETILSRCLQIQLRPMAVETILQQLQLICTKENLATDDEGLRLIAEAAQGSMRDALSILEKVASFTRSTGENMAASVVERILGRPPQQELKKLCSAIKNGEVNKAIEVVRNFFSQDIEPLAIAKGLLKAFHAAMCSTIGSGLNEENLLKELDIPQLNRLWAIVHNSINEIIHSPLSKESCEVMIMRLCYVSDLPPLKQLIQDMEQKLTSENRGSPTASSSEKTSAPIVSTTSSKIDTEFTTFNKLVEWVDAQRDPHLSYFLKRDLRVHGFTPGYIECSIKSASDTNLLRELKQLLQTRLNEKWVVELVHTTTVTPSTLYEQQQRIETEEKQQVLQSSLIQHAINTFAGSTVTVDKCREPLDG